MTRFYLNLFLFFVWCGFSNNFEPPNLVLGVSVAMLVSHLIMPTKITIAFHPWQATKLLLLVLWELFRSSLQVGREIITPGIQSTAKIIHYQHACKHSWQTNILANLISLTPGTLALDVLPEQQQIVIHVMFSEKENEFIDFIRHQLEPLIQRTFAHA